MSLSNITTHALPSGNNLSSWILESDMNLENTIAVMQLYIYTGACREWDKHASSWKLHVLFGGGRE